MGDKLLFYLRKISFIWILLKIYFYISWFILALYPFWFWIDKLKKSEHPVIKWTTWILENYFLYIIIFALVWMILKFIIEEFIINKLKKIESKNKELEGEVLNWRKEASLLLESHIYWLSKKMNFWDDDNGFVNRLSIYKKDSNWFYCIWRYSDSVEFKKKSKKIYLNKGILFQIWDKWNRLDKWFFDNEIPKNRISYRKYHKETYWLTEEDLDNLHMKSLLYYWYRIDNENGEPESVILFETNKKDKFTNKQLDTIFSNNIPIIEHVLKFILPNITKPLYDSNKQL